jgi:predicted kinase
MLVVMSGLPGTGKSALARRLGERLRIPVLSVDAIESAILRAGMAQSFATGLAAYLVAETLADAQLRAGQGVVVDAVNAVEPAKAMWRDLASRHGIAPRIVACACSDEALHRERLASRGQRFDGFPEPTWDDVVRRRTEFTPWREPVLAVDAANPLDANVERVLAWVQGGA